MKAVAATTEGDRITAVSAIGSRRRAPDPVPPAARASTPPSSATCCRSRGAEYVVGAETVAETGEPQAQPARAEAALRAELHLHLRPASAAARASSTSIPAPREVRALPRGAALQPPHRGPRRRDLRRGQRLARVPALRHACPAPRAGCGPTAGCSTASCFAGADPTRPHDVQLAGQRLPRPEHPRLSRRIDAAARAAGREAREPRLPALAADRGAGDRARGSAPRSSGSGPT